MQIWAWGRLYIDLAERLGGPGKATEGAGRQITKRADRNDRRASWKRG